MKDYKNERSLSMVAALLLFAVFAVGVLTVLLSGAESYRGLIRREDASYNSRICAQYLASKLRQAPDPNAVGISDFGGADALQIAQNIEGEIYVTRIYCYQGWLMELFGTAEGEFSPEDGEKVLQASAFSVTRQRDLLLISITDANGQRLELKHTLRGWEEMP